MKIIDHRLCHDNGLPYPFVESPNHGGVITPELLTFHYTAGGGVGAVTDHFCNPDADASAHLVIGRDLSIMQYVPFNIRAWHAGVSSWEGRQNVNDFSIGMELDNAGMLEPCGSHWKSWWGRVYLDYEVRTAIHRNRTERKGWHIYRLDQIEMAVRVAKLLVGHYNLRGIVGHDDVAPDRKVDPGPLFPMDDVRQKVWDHERTPQSILLDTSHDIMTNALQHRADRPDLRMLVEEVGELASALAGDHEHDPEFELLQIGGIALHWLINIRDPDNEDWA